MLTFFYGEIFTTAFPVGLPLVQTWNTGLLEEVGRAVRRQRPHYARNRKEKKLILSALKKGIIKEEDIKGCAANVLRSIVCSNLAKEVTIMD